MEYQPKHSGVIITTVLAVVLVIAALLLVSDFGTSGSILQQSIKENQDFRTNVISPSERRLSVSAKISQTAAITIFTEEDLALNSAGTLRYHGVTDVCYIYNGEPINLDEAIRSKTITFEDISAYAQSDAVNGICQKYSESRRGLTHFTYTYPEFDLRIIHDIYETPDGKQHLINELVFYAPGCADGAYTDFRDQETGYRLDREDWGIHFNITEVSPSGITIQCIQSNGQQVGDLYATGYAVLVPQGGVPRLDGSSQTPPLNVQIVADDTTIMEIDWTDIYGELPSGKYEFLLHIYDFFDESQVHPLMIDYHDWQVYDFYFDIP